MRVNGKNVQRPEEYVKRYKGKPEMGGSRWGGAATTVAQIVEGVGRGSANQAVTSFLRDVASLEAHGRKWEALAHAEQVSLIQTVQVTGPSRPLWQAFEDVSKL